MRADLIVFADELMTCAGEGDLRRGGAFGDAGLVKKGMVAVKDGAVLYAGPADGAHFDCDEDNTLYGRLVTPGLIDSHTHPIFAGSRVKEYMLRSQGASYLEILAQGGGILSTVEATGAASDDALYANTMENFDRMLSHGTTSAEAKSGYGLSYEQELRLLRILRLAAENHPLEVVNTFLGAHAVPVSHAADRAGYVDLVCREMIPRVAREGLAEFADVFCEEGAFTLDETGRIFETALQYGLGIRIHSEQFHSSGSAVMAARMGARSCDHMLHVSDGDIEILAGLNTVCTFLPGVELSLNSGDYGPGRKAADAGVPVAVATDFNAGSCLSESMPMAMSLAVLAMKFLPQEALNAATVNAAYALGMEKRAGTLEPGKQADLVIWDCGDFQSWLYHFGVNMAQTVVKKGFVVYRSGAVVRR